GSLSFAESELVGKVVSAWHVAGSWQHGGNFWHQLETAEVMRPSDADLWITFPQCPVPAAQYRRLQQVGKRRGRERRPVLAEHGRESIFLPSFVVQAHIRQSNRGHARADRRQVPVVGAAEIPLKISLDLSRHGEIWRGIQPFEVGTEPRGARLNVK